MYVCMYIYTSFNTYGAGMWMHVYVNIAHICIYALYIYTFCGRHKHRT